MKNINQILLIIYFWSVAIASVFLVINEISTGSSSKTSVILNYSILKSLELIVLFILSMTLIYFAEKFHFSISFRSILLSILYKNKKFLSFVLYLSISAFIGCIGIITISVPSFLLNKTQPLFYWLIFVSGSTILLLLYNNSLVIFQKIRHNFKLFSIIFSILIIIWIFYLVIISKYRAEDGPGQPTLAVTWHQGLFVIWIMLTSEYIKSITSYWKIKTIWISFFIILTLFLISGSIWNSIPFQGSYNMVGPFRPGMEWFPHSDSVRFDVASQSIFIGEGINYRRYVDNPLMVSYVAFLHFLRGGLFSDVIFLQVWIFAFIPPLVFLTGKKLFGLSAGLGSAIFYIFRVNNLILNSDNTGLVSPKILLSECILEPLLILLVLTFLVWLSSKTNKSLFLVTMGGLFGLSTLVRANVWFILPLMLLVVFYLAWPHKWIGLRHCAIILISVLITISPWMWRSTQTINTPFFMLFKFQHSILQERYGLSISDFTNDFQESAIQNNDDFQLFTSMQNTIVQLSESSFYSFAHSTFLLPFESSKIGSISGLIFPRRFLFEFNPSVPLINKVSIVFTLILAFAFLSIGITYTLKKKISAGFPLFVYFAYIFASAAARTSGSRYTQPVEWILLILFAGGWSLLFNTIFSNRFGISEEISNKSTAIPISLDSINISSKLETIGLYFGVFVIFCISIFTVLPDYIKNERYPIFDKNELTKELIYNLQDANSIIEIDSILASTNSDINKGRIIYSLGLRGDKEYFHPFFEQMPYLKPKGFDMLALYIIFPSGGRWVTLNMQQQDWPNQTLVWKDALYLGCAQIKVTQLSNFVIINNDGSKNSYQSNPKISCDLNKP